VNKLIKIKLIKWIHIFLIYRRFLGDKIIVYELIYNNFKLHTLNGNVNI